MFDNEKKNGMDIEPPPGSKEELQAKLKKKKQQLRHGNKNIHHQLSKEEKKTMLKHLKHLM